jgi:hypothetical protein
MRCFYSVQNHLRFFVISHFVDDTHISASCLAAVVRWVEAETVGEHAKPIQYQHLVSTHSQKPRRIKTGSQPSCCNRNQQRTVLFNGSMLWVNPPFWPESAGRHCRQQRQRWQQWSQEQPAQISGTGNIDGCMGQHVTLLLSSTHLHLPSVVWWWILEDNYFL